MREISHLTGITIAGTAIILAVGGFALTPAAHGHAAVRPPAAARMRDPQVRQAGGAALRPGAARPGAARPGAAQRAGGARGAGAARQAAGRPGQPLGIRFSGVRPGSPMASPHGQHSSGGFTAEMTGARSTNWAGYAATQPDHPLRFVQATFFVPYVNCSTTADSFSAHWVGLDGFNTSTVEQTGVLAACQGGKPIYAAWYEMFPDFPVYPNIVVHPGDSIMVSVFYRNSTKRFVISLTDTSNGRHFTRILACPQGSRCQRASAEVISEPPSSNGMILPLTDFRAESFTGIRVTDQTGFRGTLRSSRWNTVRITTVGAASGAVIDQPTQLFRGATFDNYWMRTS